MRIVQKFGGTSVADIDKIKSVAEKIRAEVKKKNEVIVVISAMAGVTNQLVHYVNEVAHTACTSSRDVVFASGEQVSAGLLSLTLNTMGIPAEPLLAWQIPILTTDVHTDAEILDIPSEKIDLCLKQGRIPVVAGYQGLSPQGKLTTLGRGGSDTTAVALAAFCKADRCDIYTDVDGVYTADPRLVPAAKKRDTITYSEMLELSAQGAKVLQARSVAFAKAHNVPVQVRSSFTSEPGTHLVPDSNQTKAITGLAHVIDCIQLSLNSSSDDSQSLATLLTALSNAKIPIDTVTKSLSISGQTQMSFTVSEGNLERTKNLIQNIQDRIAYTSISTDPTIAKVSLVGGHLDKKTGLTSQILNCLSRHGIPAQLETISDKTITMIVSQSKLEPALKALHTLFNLD